MRYEIFSNGDITPLKINIIGFATNPAVTRFGPGARSLYIIHYVTKGMGYYNGKTVSEGQGFLITPGISVEYHADAENPWEFLWIASDDNAMKEIFIKYNADPESLIFNYDSVPEARKIANEIVSKSGEILVPLKVLEMFLHILNSHVYTPNSTHSKLNSEVYLDFCVDFIAKNIHRKITVDELSALVGVSQPYLYKIFKNKFNMSTKEYIVWYKMNNAKKLLKETDMSITEIANSIGFSDVLAFSKAFSAKEKMSPQKYRHLA